MKILKKILSLIPLLIGILIIVGALSGKLQEETDKLKNKIEEKKSKDEESKSIQNDEEDETIEIPEGKIVLKDYFKDWETEPLVEVYDPDNKIAKNGVYGLTKDEYEYGTKLGYEQNELDENTEIPEEYKGEMVFNKEKIVNWGEEFDMKRQQAKYVCDNLRIRENFKGLDEKYYTDCKKDLLSVLDENGEIKNDISTGEANITTENYNYKLVMFDVTITPYSDWVTNLEVTPELKFVDDKEKALIRSDYSYEFGELNSLIYSERPIYYDLGLYDVDKPGYDEDTVICSMRKGEIIKFTVGYLIPEELFDKVCFVYRGDDHIGSEYSYLTEDLAILQIGENIR